MELNEGIRKRRSIRKYTNDSISDEHLRQILESALEAPSAGNLQSRYFYVVQDQKLKASLASAALNQAFIGEAPVSVVACADHRIRAEYGVRGIDVYAIMDCAAAIENMLLTACSLGLGSCWVGAFDESAVVKTLGIPAHLRPLAIITFGYASESPDRPDRVSVEKVCEFR
jgi:nitroreductase